MAKRYKKDGWAITKWKHHKNHPAYYRKKGNNNIEYVTFTSSNVVDFGDEKISTQRLNRNINKDSRKNKTEFSYVVPRVYLGTRDSLGKGTNDFVLYKEDFDLIMNIFSNSPKVNVPIILVKKKKRKK